MNVISAKNVARAWVNGHAATIPGFRGAFFHGSANWLADDATLPETSDLDVMVVLNSPEPPEKPGKFTYGDVLLEISYLGNELIGSPEIVLSNYHLAGSFRTASAISDPFGDLERVQCVVARDFAQRRWVEARCRDAERNLRKHLASFDGEGPFHAQITAWLFATGVTTHLLLVAGLKNPTVRTRYLAARELLADYGCSEFYDLLLNQLGCFEMTAAEVAGHLDTLTRAFDAARRYVSTPFPFAADISAAGRPVAIDGSRALIARGDHREAIFWIAATYARCQNVLRHDAPLEVRRQFDPGFRALVAGLGIASTADLIRRNRQTLEFLPSVRSQAHAIMAANPDIRPD